VRRLAVTLASAFVAVGCGGEDQQPADEQQASFPRASAVIERRDGQTVELTVEVAGTEEEHSRGLMGRESLPPDHGMLFVFDEPTREGFWMKDTLIPLSIAFIAEDGRILEVLDMEPCRADPCPAYAPGVEYHRALEVEQGAFRRWGVEPGDRIRLAP
jgi:uncharacterized protein